MHRDIYQNNVKQFLDSFSDIFKLALDIYRAEYIISKNHSCVLTIYGRKDNTSYVELLNKNQSCLFAVEGNFIDKKIEIDIEKVFEDHKVFLNMQIKAIKIGLEGESLIINIRNKKLNSVKLRFEASDYDIDLYMRSNVKNVYNDDDNLYNIDVKIPTLRLIGQIMNDRYEKMIRTELNITSRGGLDVFPGLVIGSYKKEDIENMINFAESILDEQEKAERNEEENSRTFIQFHMYLKRDINTMKEMLKEEKDEYHLLTYLPMAYLPKTNNKEYDEIRRDLLWRVYNCRNLHNNEILIESKDLFFLSNLAMLDNAIDSVLQIKANYLTGSKLLIVDMYKYKMFYVPATKVNEEDNNLFIVYGMRAYPILEGFDEERISYLLQKVSEVVEFTEKYVKSKEYEDYLASIFPILEKMHERLKGQSWFDRVYERAKSLHESYVENHNKVVLLRHLNAMLHSKQEV